jgi:hypothetical protein
MVAIIELARTESQNPEVPEWLRDDYFRSIQELAQNGHQGHFVCRRIGDQTSHPQRHCDCERSSDSREFLVAYSEDESSEMEP